MKSERLTSLDQHSRTTVKWPVCLVTPVSILEGEAAGISPEGVLISCRESPPLEGTFSLLLEIPDRPPLKATVQLAWTSLFEADDVAPTLGAYLQFVSLSDADRQFLEDFTTGARDRDAHGMTSIPENMPARSGEAEDVTFCGATPAQEPAGPPGDRETLSVKVLARLHMADVARALGTEFEALRDLNPHIRGYYLPVGQYTLHLPCGLGFKMPAVLQQLSRSVSLRGDRIPDHYYVVQAGDSLKSIARKTGVSATKLRKLNALNGNVVRAGQRLRLKSGKQC